MYTNGLGILNSREATSFKMSLIKSKLNENKNKLLHQLGIKTYNTPHFDDIKIPDSRLASLAIEEANDIYDTSLLKHCYRTYFFSAGLAYSQNLKIDEEFLFVTSILHDVGLTATHNHICSQQCFAIHGGHFVKYFAIKNGTEKQRANRMKLAIDAHLNPYVNKKTFGNEAYALSKGAAMDVIGAHAFQLPHDFIKTTHKNFPRTNFKSDILNTMTELHHKEHTRADILFKMGFQKLASNNKLDLHNIKNT